MIKSRYFPKKTFSSKEELFAELKKHEDKIIEFKKSVVYDSEKKTQCFGNLTIKENVLKGIGFTTKLNYIYPIISTTRFFDSHQDVHFDGCFKKTVKEQQGSVYYCADHNLTVDGIIALKKDVEMFVDNISWEFVNKDYKGSTEALIFSINKDAIIHDKAAEIIENDSALQNSIRMKYVIVKMAINSNELMYAENKAYWDAKINLIANKEDAIKEGYFFGVEELKIEKEGSLVIAGGSNSATAIYQDFTEEIEADSVTSSKNNEPSNDTQQKQTINYNYILQTIKQKP